MVGQKQLGPLVIDRPARRVQLWEASIMVAMAIWATLSSLVMLMFLAQIGSELGFWRMVRMALIWVAIFGVLTATLTLWDRARRGEPVFQGSGSELMAANPLPGHYAALAASGAAAMIEKDDDGHFWAEGEVNGQEIRLLVDTGASYVTLTRDDAEDWGFAPSGDAFDAEVNTANGRTRAALVTIPHLEVGGVVVENVRALILERGLEQSLLGMSFLSRLSKWEATPDALLLTP